MDWLAQNWFWVALMGVFIGMHLFGHGCGGHGRNTASSESGPDKPTARQH